jgi:hypothetical protein
VLEDDPASVTIVARHAAVFSNWIPFRRQIENLGLSRRRNVVLDLADTKLVDHSVMDKLHELQHEFEDENLMLTVVGLDTHQPLAPHALAARRRGLARVRRVTIVAEAELAETLEQGIVRLGASGYTSIPCTGSGRSEIAADEVGRDIPHVRIEAIVPWSVCEAILGFVRRDIHGRHDVTVCVETVEVLRLDDFTPGAEYRTDSPHSATRPATSTVPARFEFDAAQRR